MNVKAPTYHMKANGKLDRNLSGDLGEKLHVRITLNFSQTF